MDKRSIHLKRISCKGVKSFLPIQKPSLYAAVSVRSDAKQRHSYQKTAVDQKGGENPEWEQPILLYLDSGSDIPNPDLILHFDLKDRVTILGDKLVGVVRVPISNLVADGYVHHVSYQVKSPDGKPNGFLNFSYKMGDPEVPEQDPRAQPLSNPKPNCQPAIPASGSAYPPLTLGDLMGVHFPPPAPGLEYYPPIEQAASSYPPEPPVSGGFYPTPSYYPPTAPVSSGYYPTPTCYPPESSASGGLYPAPGFYPPQTPVSVGLYPTPCLYPSETPASGGSYSTPSYYPPPPELPITGGWYPPLGSYPPHNTSGCYNAPPDSCRYQAEGWNSRCSY
ncbi:protein SRC2-like [Typha angustifolia]|uniref:protein SRC2-like n=1 Tax=Typha angustifolia TaxID=59011 RepID=UPI003C2DEF8A